MADPESDDRGDPWAPRIARARLLADRYPAAEEILTFYARLAERQRALLLASPGAGVRQGNGRVVDRLDPDLVLAAAPGFLEWLAMAAPAPLAAFARATIADSARWRRLLDARLTGEAEDVADEEAFVIEALLQPFAERAASGSRLLNVPGAHTSASAQCPACAGLPVVGVLREEGHGARRRLVCALCLTEWDYQRVRCPACGEDGFDALPVFTAEQCAHIRIEACGTCRRYLKTIDATRDGHAVPLVDDLATVSLDLWARDQGYVRLRANLLRV
jgi:FdhE protein